MTKPQERQALYPRPEVPGLFGQFGKPGMVKRGSTLMSCMPRGGRRNEPTTHFEKIITVYWGPFPC